MENIENKKEKPEEQKVASHIYLIFPVSKMNGYDEKINIKNGKMKKEYDAYEKEMEATYKYECIEEVSSSIKKKYLGSYKFPIIKDDKYGEFNGCVKYEKCIKRIKEVDVFVSMSSHEDSKTYLLTIVIPIPEDSYLVTNILDQISSSNIYLRNKKYDKEYDKVDSFKEYDKVDSFIKENLKVEREGDYKTVICLKEKPEEEILTAILAGESYDSKEVDYGINKGVMKESLENNIAKYNFYEAYISRKVFLYALKDFNEDYIKNVEKETLLLYIIELVIFKYGALKIATKKISKIENGAKLEKVIKINEYVEKSPMSWNNDTVKYLLAKELYQDIEKWFKINEAEEYYVMKNNLIEKRLELYEMRKIKELTKDAITIAIKSLVVAIIGIYISTQKNYKIWRNIERNEYIIAIVITLILIMPALLAVKHYFSNKN